jgi:hypothetical protein
MTGIMIDTSDGIQAFHMLSQYHAAKLELKGLKHSSGRSVIAHIKRTYCLKGNRQKVVTEFESMLKERGVINV